MSIYLFFFSSSLKELEYSNKRSSLNREQGNEGNVLNYELIMTVTEQTII